MIQLNSSNARPLTEKEKIGARLATFAFVAHFILIFFFIIFPEYYNISPFWMDHVAFFRESAVRFGNGFDDYSKPLAQIYPLPFVFFPVNIVIAWIYFMDDFETRIVTLIKRRLPVLILLMFVLVLTYLDYSVSYSPRSGFNNYHDLLFSTVYGVVIMQLSIIIALDMLFKATFVYLRYVIGNLKCLINGSRI
jgi:hypothetical protein